MDSRITRRTLSAGALATAVRLSLPGRPTSGQEEERVLRILGWPSYFPGELTAAFREANNVRIEVTGIATPDDTMLFLRAGGVGLYDLVAPTIGIVAPLGASGLLAPLDLASIPNSVDLLSPFGERPEVMVDDQQFGMPLLWGTFGLVAAVEVESAPESWLDLRDERYTDQLVMPDDGLTHITLWNWALGAEDPLRVSKDALDETTGVLIELKQTRAASFGGSAYDAMMRVALTPSDMDARLRGLYEGQMAVAVAYFQRFAVDSGWSQNDIACDAARVLFGPDGAWRAGLMRRKQ
ncbi:MAG: extracellular solute-binding protein [Thermomicrobiales bacterium]|nr:extracellular solute-binding protein [Thermomicrobiales bacterium]